MSLQMYGLDQIAQKLVLVCRSSTDSGDASPKYRNQEVLGQAYKMRTTVAYGLERFWGEHLRLGIETPEGRYWKDVWDALAEDILKPAQIELPNDPANNQERIYQMANKLWSFAQENPNDQRIALSVLTQLCDCLVWWTQRYKQN